MRRVIVASLIAIGLLTGPSTTRAAVSDAPNYIIGSFAVGVPYVAISAVLIGEGLDDASRGHGLAEAGAVVEIVWAGLHLAAGTGLLIAGTAACAGGCAVEDPLPAIFGVGATLTVVGVPYLAHGIWSLTAGRPPPPVTAALVPIEGGLLANGRFNF